MHMELSKYLLTDMKQPISYIPQGILTGVVAVMVMYLVWKRRKAESDTKKLAVFFMLFLYGTVLAVQTFFSRTPGTRRSIELGLLGTWGTTWQAHAYVIENVILFLPLGILLPLADRRLAQWKRIFLISVGCSVMIEVLQYITARGYSQLDDVVTNTLGGCLGYIIYKTLIRLKRKK